MARRHCGRPCEANFGNRARCPQSRMPLDTGPWHSVRCWLETTGGELHARTRSGRRTEANRLSAATGAGAELAGPKQVFISYRRDDNRMTVAVLQKALRDRPDIA